MPKAFLHLPGEDWSSWKRLTAWVCPDIPGYRNPCIRFEITDVPRDHVTGVSFDYDMVGHEPCANGQACWYIGDIQLEKVDKPDQYEGWNTAKGRIAFSHLGYQHGVEKIAIACDAGSDHFVLEDAETGQELFAGKVQKVRTSTGQFDVMIFTDFRQGCCCILRVGEYRTQPFDISTTVWMESIWKSLNYIFYQRCGFRVPGKHDACHTDQRTRHGDKEIIANGGWHDAADTKQQFQLTCEATHALFELAMRVEKQDELLYRRVLDEAIWGLSNLLKGRFGDGWRTGPSSSGVWTDGTTAYIRNDEGPSYVVHSQDCGETWSALMENAMNIGNSKMFAGNLVDGRPFLIYNQNRGYFVRTLLVLAVGDQKPGRSAGYTRFLKATMSS